MTKRRYAKADFPFTGYLVSELVWSKPTERYFVFLKKPNERAQRTFTVARYKMCVYLGEDLDSDCEVDHIDDNKLNDDLCNLQVLTGSENRKKNASLKTKEYVELICPWCREQFSKAKNVSHLIVKNKTIDCCSRACGNKMKSLKLQKDPEKRKEYVERSKNSVVRTYRLEKNYVCTPLHQVGEFKETSSIFQVGTVETFTLNSKGGPFGTLLDQKNFIDRKRIIPVCTRCSKELIADQKKYCSQECYSASQVKKTKPSKEQLAVDLPLLNWESLGRKYKVSGNAVRKWAKGYDLTKPKK